jgi:PAS domain S-box-containing protein
MTRLLIVEDSPTQAEELRLILESEGFEVETAPDGKKGLDRALAESFEAIVSDIVMPGLSGYELCRHLKAEKRTKDVPVILLTSLSDPMDIIEGLECGADNFITKPYKPEQLVDRLRTILANKAMRAAGKLKVGVEVFFLGKKFTITSEKEQILDLLISTFEDVVRKHQEVLAQEADLRRANETLAGLYRVATRLNEARSVAEVVERALDAALSMPGVCAGWIALRREDGRFEIAGARGLPPALAAPGAFEGDCLCRRMAASGELGPQGSLIVECERLAHAAEAGEETGGIRSHASVLLAGGEGLLGILNLAGPNVGLFPDGDLATLAAVGRQVATAIEGARLRERLEARARSSEERYRLLMENAHDAIAITDCAGNIREVNREAERLFGLSRERILGRNFREFVAVTEAAEVDAIFARLSAEGSARASGVSIERAGGEKAIADLLAAVIEIGGEPLVVLNGHDVTEKKRAEEALRKVEEQFRQAQKMEAIGRLAGGVAHDFNNLLTGITGYADLLGMRLPAVPEIQRDLDEIKKAAQRAAALTRQLLAFSRKQILSPKVLDLNGVVSALYPMLKRIIGEDIELLSVLPSDLGRVKADRGQIEQVLLNLAVNARDAMPKGGKLTIETANVDLDETYAATHLGVNPGRYVMLAVGDTGIGMDAETKAHLFEPFFTTKEVGKGTGLGLSTVYGIVKQSGGNVWVYSEPGHGATFKIYLPRVDAPLEESGPIGAPPALARGTETILLVEDEEIVRSVAVRVLSAQGYTVIEARSGEEAIAAASAHRARIDLLLTDVVMPGMSGRDLARRLEAVRPEMRVLYISGYAKNGIVHHGVLEPGTSFLQKPFTPGALARAVREAIDRGKSGGRSPP